MYILNDIKRYSTGPAMKKSGFTSSIVRLGIWDL